MTTTMENPGELIAIAEPPIYAELVDELGDPDTYGDDDAKADGEDEKVEPGGTEPEEDVEEAPQEPDAVPDTQRELEEGDPDPATPEAVPAEAPPEEAAETDGNE